MNKYDQQTYKLVESSTQFELINNKINRFNPFKILRVDKFEIRHSNLFAWLLDPTENHKLGNFFVKKFLAKVILKQENESLLENHNIDFLYIKNSSFGDLEVLREVSTDTGRKIDLLAVSESKKLVLLIENKYKSGESEGQLDDYLNFAQKKYSGYKILPIFLSLYGVEPTNENYLMADYSDVLNILTDFMKVNEDYVNRNIGDFIKYYIDVLETELVKDEEDIALASEIYKLHKDAVDMLTISDKNNRGVADKYVSKDVRNYFDSLVEANKEGYYKTYLKYKQTIDFISTIGNDTMRGAFSLFVAANNMAKEYYNNHIKMPSFILPKFLELNDVLGVPKWSYWLNNAFRP